MKEIYYLNKKILPTISVPHDCVVKDIQLKGQTLTFLFEDDISSHDSIQAIHPNAKSLIIRYHLTEEDGFPSMSGENPESFPGKMAVTAVWTTPGCLRLRAILNICTTMWATAPSLLNCLRTTE